MQWPVRAAPGRCKSAAVIGVLFITNLDGVSGAGSFDDIRVACAVAVFVFSSICYEAGDGYCVGRGAKMLERRRIVKCLYFNCWRVCSG